MRSHRTKAVDWTRMDLIVFCLFLIVIFCFGGASRADAVAQTVVRFAAVLLLGYGVLRLDGKSWRRGRVMIVFLLASALLITMQLVPLPFSLWSALPGHAPVAQALRQGGIAPVWRPLSLAPDLTLNSLLALLPALAMTIGLALIEPRRLALLLLPVLLGAVAITSILGIVQVSTQNLYFFDITNFGAAVGVFANRNHQAVLLATAFPLLACWVMMPSDDRNYRDVRIWIALCFGAALFPMLLMTGSRSGLLLGGAGLVGAGILLWTDNRFSLRGDSWLSTILKLIPVLVGAGAIMAMVLWSRGEAFNRLVANSNEDERFSNLPYLIHVLGDFMPTGSGFGTFDPVFRMYEPYEMLDATYLNHAHNDFLEIAIEGGVFSLLLLGVFLVWFVRSSWNVWRDPKASFARMLGRTGSILILILLGASGVDYPLRTPLMAGLFVVAATWLLAARSAVAGPD